MRSATLVVATVALLASGSSAAAAPKLTLKMPPPGGIEVGVIGLQSHGSAARRPLRIRIDGLASNVDAVTVVHTTVRGATTARTILFAVYNRGAQRSVSAAKDDVPDLTLVANGYGAGDGRFTEGDLSGFSEVIAKAGAEYLRKQAEWPQIKARLRKAILGDLDKRFAHVAVANLDTHHYDDGHSFGWKPPAPRLARDMVDLVEGKPWNTVIPALEEDLHADLPPDGTGGTTTTTPVTGTYTCSGPNNLIFDNWNQGTAANGGKPATFDTSGKAYCVTTVATYHWNGGKGAPPGTISLRQGSKDILSWPSVGQAPDGSPGNINWIANLPAGSGPVVVQGVVTCVDSSPTTWAQNAESKGVGFCRIWGQVATKGP